MLIGVKGQEWVCFTSQPASELCAMFFCIQMAPYGQVYCGSPGRGNGKAPSECSETQNNLR